MNRAMKCGQIGFLFLVGLGVPGTQAQQPVAAELPAPSGTVQAPREVVPALPVPRLVKFAGMVKDEQGKQRTGVVGVTFAVYKEQEGGAALWLETQNVELDEQGHYTVLLGATKNEGLPLELFSSGEPRWLGVQVNLPKEVEQARVLLVSVPYALKASDADTLGGKPLSSFVLTNAAGGSSGGTVLNGSGPIVSQVGGSGTQNFVAKFDATGANVVNSTIFDDGTNVGIGTSSPARTLHIKSAAPVIRLEDSTLPNSFWELQQSAFVNDTFGFLRYENGSAVEGKSFVVSSAGNLGIGTGTPQRKLHIKSSAPVIRLEDTNLPNSFWELQQSAFVLDTFGFLRYENGTAVQSKSFVMSSGGNFGIGTGTPTQKLEVAGNVKISGGGNALVFPDGTVMTSAGVGTNGGTITGVTAGTGVTGGGTTGGVNLAIDPAVVPQLGATSNTFTGSITAASFSGGAASLNALALPSTTSASVGVISLGGAPFVHNFGINNIFVGTSAGNTSATLTGSSNAAFGLNALSAITTGGANSAFGQNALVSDTTGNSNQGFGFAALQQNTTGNFNSAFGQFALGKLLSGNSNVAIGFAAGNSLSSAESNDIYISNTGSSGESKTIRIGTQGTQTQTFIAGISGATSASGVAVFVNGNGQLGTATSSRRFKDDIADMAGDSDLLMKLRPVAFYYKPELDETHTRQYGLVAEEVAQVAPQLVVFDKDGAPQTVRYHFVNAMLLNEVQKQHRQLEEQQREIRRLRTEVANLRKTHQAMAQLEARLARLESQQKATPAVVSAVKVGDRSSGTTQGR